MKFTPLIFLLLVACDRQQVPPQAAPTIQVAPATQFGHISPIQLPAGEYFAGFYTVPAVYGYQSLHCQEHYFFSTTTRPSFTTPGTHTLRDSGGTPILIVIDPHP